jgi:ribA/ribD-fused uncharacterized protein
MVKPVPFPNWIADNIPTKGKRNPGFICFYGKPHSKLTRCDFFFSTKTDEHPKDPETLCFWNLWMQDNNLISFLGQEYRNSEAAFQVQKFPGDEYKFKSVDGEGAWKLSRPGVLNSFRNDWDKVSFSIMRDVLRAKFKEGTDMARILISTGNSFLQEHNPKEGRDKKWSDNHDGTGTNWLGICLMLCREELLGVNIWTNWLSYHIDLETGAPKQEGELSAIIEYVAQTMNHLCVQNEPVYNAYEELLDNHNPR